VVPPTIDYILSLIPTYTVHIKNNGGGTIVTKGDAGEGEINQDTTFKMWGSANITLTATANQGNTFEGWKVDKKPLDKDNPYDLVLNPRNFPGASSQADPWGTQVDVTVEAVWSTTGATKKPAVQNFSKWGWFAGLSWAPQLHIPRKDNGDDILNQGWFPLGIEARAGAYPLYGSWGAVGFGMETGYAGLWGTHGSWNTRGNMVFLGFYAAYRAPTFFGFLTPGLRLGGGMSPMFGAEIKQGSTTGWKSKQIQLYSYIDGGIFARVLDYQHIYFALSLDFRAYVFKTISRSPMYLIPSVEAGWRF
jgi:hypothetical protein